MGYNRRPVSPYAGRTVKMKGKAESITIEDWWVNVYGLSWMFSEGNPAAILYAIRVAKEHLPTDNDVLYGKVRGMGVLVHLSELEPLEES